MMKLSTGVRAQEAFLTFGIDGLAGGWKD